MPQLYLFKTHRQHGGMFVLHRDHRAWVGLSIGLIYSLIGRCHTRPSLPVIILRRITPIGAMWLEDVWTAEMSKENVGGQLGGFIAHSQYLRSTFGTLPDSCLSPASQKITRVIFGMEAYALLTRMLLLSLHTRDMLATLWEQ